MTRRADILLLAMCVAAVSVLVLTTGSYLNSPLRADEADWSVQAKAIAAYGVPKLSFSEARLQQAGHYFGYDAYYGMWHPPLYQYALALAYLVGGDRDWIYRSVGTLCLILTLLIVRRMSAEAGGVSPPLAGWLPLALPLLSPIVVDGNLVVDIDNTTLMASMALVLWRFLRPGDPFSVARTVELSLLLCLTLLSKLTTPFVLMACLGLYAALGPRPVRAVASVAAASVAAIALFGVLYWLYCTWLDYPPRFMFDVSYFGKRDMYRSVKNLRSVLFAVRWNVVWVSPLVGLLLATVTWTRIARYWRVRVPEPVDLLVIFSWATFACYALLGAMWGKYVVPAALVAGVAIGIELRKAWPELRLTRPGALVAGLAALAVTAALLPIPYARPGLADSQAGVVTLLADPRNLSAAALTMLSVIMAFAAVTFWLRAGSRRLAGWQIALAGCLAVTTAVTSARLVLTTYDRGPLRPFSDRGFRATGEYLNRTAAPDDAILAVKDFARYYKGRVFPLSTVLTPTDASLALEAARRADVRFIVDSAVYPLVRERGFYESLDIARVETVGDYRIYVKQ